MISMRLTVEHEKILSLLIYSIFYRGNMKWLIKNSVCELKGVLADILSGSCCRTDLMPHRRQNMQKNNFEVSTKCIFKFLRDSGSNVPALVYG